MNQQAKGAARRAVSRIFNLHLLAAAALLACAGQAAAQSYQLVFLNPGMTITGNTSTNRALDVNNIGQFVGVAQPGAGAAVTGAQWNSSAGNATFYGGAFLTSINDGGQFSGQNGATATRWNPNGSSTSLGTLGGSSSFGTDINNAGAVAGYSTTAGGATHAFVWDGSMHDLGTLGGSSSHGNGINATGTVVGYSDVAGNTTAHAAAWSNGVATDLGALAGYLSSQAAAVNNAGQIVGFSDTTANFFGTDHATLWSGGSATDLGVLAGAQYSYATDINSAGLIVGDSGGRAVLFEGGSVLDLNSFLSAGQQGQVRLTHAYGINDQGWIVGQAQDIGACNGLCSAAFVMIPLPVPEPGAWALMLAGLGLLGMMARRRRA